MFFCSAGSGGRSAKSTQVKWGFCAFGFGGYNHGIQHCALRRGRGVGGGAAELGSELDSALDSELSSPPASELDDDELLLELLTMVLEEELLLELLEEELEDDELLELLLELLEE